MLGKKRPKINSLYRNDSDKKRKLNCFATNFHLDKLTEIDILFQILEVFQKLLSENVYNPFMLPTDFLNQKLLFGSVNFLCYFVDFTIKINFIDSLTKSNRTKPDDKTLLVTEFD